MNHELWRLFRNLNETQRNRLLADFHDSPKTLSLVHFLDAQTGDFKTPRAVHHIYQDEKQEVDFEILTNRYYKLRQALRDWLVQALEAEEQWLTEEEKDWAFLRAMIGRNEFGFALSRLLELEKKCQDLALYEILAEVRQGILVCYQARGYQIPENEMSEHENACRQAVEDRKTLHTMQMHNRLAFRHDAIETQLEALRKIAQKHKQNPRFQLIYHYAAFTRGVFVPGKCQAQSTTLLKHLKTYLQLRKQYPKIPLTRYEPLHIEKAQYDLLLCQAAFHHALGQDQEACTKALERETLRRNWPSLQPQRSEGEYNNLLIIWINNQAFDQAFELLEDLWEFQAQQGSEPIKQCFYYMGLLRLYCYTYPKVQPENPRQLYQQVEVLLGQLDKKHPNYGYLVFLQFEFAWQFKLRSELNWPRLMNNEYAAMIYKAYGLDEATIKSFFKLIRQGQFQTAKNLFLKAEAIGKIYLSNIQTHRQWLMKILEQDN